MSKTATAEFFAGSLLQFCATTVVSACLYTGTTSEVGESQPGHSMLLYPPQVVERRRLRNRHLSWGRMLGLRYPSQLSKPIFGQDRDHYSVLCTSGGYSYVAYSPVLKLVPSTEGHESQQVGSGNVQRAHRNPS